MYSQDYLYCKIDLSERVTIWFHCQKAVDLYFADKKTEMKEQPRHAYPLNIPCAPSIVKHRLKKSNTPHKYILKCSKPQQ